MNGLVIKELIQLRKGIKWYVIVGICVGICIICLGTGDGATFWAWAWFMSSGLGVMNADVSSRFNRYNITMPMNRGDIIKSKYVLISIYEVVGCLILLAGEVAYILRTGECAICEMNKVVIFIISNSLVTTVSAIFIFGKGIRRGQRIALPVGIAIEVGTFIGLRYMEHIGMFETYMLIGYSIVGLLVVIALRAVSLPLSIKLYEKRSL